MTIGLLATSACLVAWMYLRDRDTNWRPSEAQIAQDDAKVILRYALHRTGCRSGCASEVLGSTGPRRWLVRITVRGRSQCLQIDLNTFTPGKGKKWGAIPESCGWGPPVVSAG